MTAHSNTIAVASYLSASLFWALSLISGSFDDCHSYLKIWLIVYGAIHFLYLGVVILYMMYSHHYWTHWLISAGVFAFDLIPFYGLSEAKCDLSKHSRLLVIADPWASLVYLLIMMYVVRAGVRARNAKEAARRAAALGGQRAAVPGNRQATQSKDANACDACDPLPAIIVDSVEPTSGQSAEQHEHSGCLSCMECFGRCTQCDFDDGDVGADFGDS